MELFYTLNYFNYKKSFFKEIFVEAEKAPLDNHFLNINLDNLKNLANILQYLNEGDRNTCFKKLFDNYFTCKHDYVHSLVLFPYDCKSLSPDERADCLSKLIKAVIEAGLSNTQVTNSIDALKSFAYDCKSLSPDERADCFKTLVDSALKAGLDKEDTATQINKSTKLLEEGSIVDVEAEINNLNQLSEDYDKETLDKKNQAGDITDPTTKNDINIVTADSLLLQD